MIKIKNKVKQLIMNYTFDNIYIVKNGIIAEAIDSCISINFDKSKYKTLSKDVKDYFLNLNEVDIINNNFKLYSNALGISLNEKNNQYLNNVISYDEHFLYCVLPLKKPGYMIHVKSFKVLENGVEKPPEAFYNLCRFYQSLMNELL